MKYKKTLIALVVGIVVMAGAWFYLNANKQTPGQPAAQPSGEIFRFAAVGDFGADNNAAKTLETIAVQKADFTLALGDFAYGQVSEDQWCKMVTDKVGKNHPFQLIAGNHDLEDDFAEYLRCLPNKIEGMQGEYGVQYAFDYENMRIIALSPGLTINNATYTYKNGTTEYKWALDAIQKAKQQDKWVVVAMHKNCLTTAEKECEVGQDLMTMLVKERADLILQGHEHGYMRSKQVTTNAECPVIMTGGYKPACIAAGSDTAFKSGEGSVIVINGTGGVALRNILPQSPDLPFFADWHGKNIQPTHGPSIIQVWDDKLQVQYVDTKGITQDSFTITR